MSIFFDPQHEFVPEDRRLYLGAIELAEALQMWRRESCEEFTGGRHPFELSVEEGRASVKCPVCHHDPLEQGDLWEYLYFGPIPVEVSINTIVHPAGPWGGPEYDVEVEVTAQ